MISIMKYLIYVLALIISLTGVAQTSRPLPFILEDENKLALYLTQYRKHDRQAVAQVDSLIAEANRLLTAGPFSVTFQKSKTAPGGTLHDYYSQAPYWWPDTTKPDGKPYIRRDGRQNPERSLIKDNIQMVRMSSSVKQLALAYYFTNNEDYAKKAVALINTWFIDTATCMNPNLDYAQFIPGINNGRGIGIIETVNLTSIPDALALLQGSKALDTTCINGTRQWFRLYLSWLLNSKNGRDESTQANNHGTYYDMQVADFALFTGNSSLAGKIIRTQTIPRIDKQFSVDGAQPMELARTKSWGYSTMNLMGWCKLAVIAERLQIDLWHTVTSDGKGIRQCIEWFSPYLKKEKRWDHEQIEPISYNSIFFIYHLAAVKYPGSQFANALAFYPDAKQVKSWW